MKKRLSLAVLAFLSSLLSYAGPGITKNVNFLRSYNYIVGTGPSASKTLVLHSSDMGTISGTVTVSSTKYYEVSLDSASFSSSVLIPYSDDTLGASNVYVRLKKGLPRGNYIGEHINIAAPGISDFVIADGLVTDTCKIRIDLLTSTIAVFSWDSTGALFYEALIDTTATDPTTWGLFQRLPEYEEWNLVPDREYYLHVRGIGMGGDYTVWTTLKFKTLSATGVYGNVKNKIGTILYPNPSRGSFTVSGNAGKEKLLNVVVTDPLGQVVYSDIVKVERESFRSTIQLQVAPGLYMVRLGSGVDCSTMPLNIAP